MSSDSETEQQQADRSVENVSDTEEREQVDQSIVVVSDADSDSGSASEQENNDHFQIMPDLNSKRSVTRAQSKKLQAQQMASSQAPEVMAASQPQLFPNDSQTAPASSQSFNLGAAAASQVVGGRFGGRPRQKKRRKSGF